MSLLLLRHVHAGDRSAHLGDDRRRPVSTTGLKQALALVDSYAGRPIVAIGSSPLTRCVQSVEPLAAALGLTIEECDELAEGSPFDVVERFLRQQLGQADRLGGDVVLCTHGDVIASVVLHLADQGVPLRDEDLRWPKASTWVIDGTLDDPEVALLAPPA